MKFNLLFEVVAPGVAGVRAVLIRNANAALPRWIPVDRRAYMVRLVY